MIAKIILLICAIMMISGIVLLPKSQKDGLLEALSLFMAFFGAIMFFVLFIAFSICPLSTNRTELVNPEILKTQSGITIVIYEKIKKESDKAIHYINSDKIKLEIRYGNTIWGKEKVINSEIVMVKNEKN
jgi:hypothetical protein